jgi:hypothetical protein
MSLPGFNAETSLHQMIFTNRPPYRRARIAPSSGQTGGVVPQARLNETFTITRGRSCYCYEDTERRMSICECW